MWQLIDAWEDLTGENAVTPKGTAPGKDREQQASQPSTEFIRLCLKMINPKIKLSEAMTSIKNALSLRDHVDKELGKQAGDADPILSWLRDNLSEGILAAAQKIRRKMLCFPSPKFLVSPRKWWQLLRVRR